MVSATPDFENLTVLSTLAFKGALEHAVPGLNAQFHATQALLTLIGQGQTADVVILTDEGIDQLEAQGKLGPGSRVALGRSGVGLAVRAGTPKPAIGSLAELTAALLAAASVGHSAQGASGLYFAGLLERLNLTDRLQQRVVVERGPVAQHVASGEIALGAQLLCELAPVPGIDIVGPLPAEAQAYYAFSAATMAATTRVEAAKAFLAFLRTDVARAAMRESLLEPA